MVKTYLVPTILSHPCAPKAYDRRDVPDGGFVSCLGYVCVCAVPMLRTPIGPLPLSTMQSTTMLEYSVETGRKYFLLRPVKPTYDRRTPQLSVHGLPAILASGDERTGLLYLFEVPITEPQLYEINRMVAEEIESWRTPFLPGIHT
jgi:hypothetical protein